MRGRLLIGTFVLALVAMACGDDASSTDDSGDEGLAVVTLNAGLADGFVDYAVERSPAVAEAVAGLDEDVVFVQEVWTPEDVEALTEATAERFPTSVFLDPMPDDPGAEAAGPACPLDEAQPLEDCARSSCGDVPATQLADCVLDRCGAEFAATCPECQACLASNVGSSIDTAIAACTQGSGAYAYDGAFGIGFLSTTPFAETDELVLDSSLTRRAVLYGRLDDTPLGAVHLFGTHLSPTFSDVPFPGEGSWEEEQLDQIETVRAWIDEKTGGTGTTVLLGDFNTGPDGVLFSGEEEPHYEALVEGGWANAYLDTLADEAECTFCDSNPLNGGDGDGGVAIDHVLVRAHDGDVDATRSLDGETEIEVDGEAVTTALSDHYAVSTVLFP